MINIAVIYHSVTGTTRQLADEVIAGAWVANMARRLTGQGNEY